MKLTLLYGYTLGALIILGLAAVSCKKNSSTDTQKPAPVSTELSNGIGSTRTVNGYLYASVNINNTWSNGTTFFATFGDPARNLLEGFNHLNDFSQFFGGSQMGNVDVGNVTFSNEITLNKSTFNPNLFYQYSSGSNTVTVPAWKTEGNTTFKPFDISIARDFPVMSSSLTLPAISKSVPYSLDFTSIVSNYDSLFIGISDFSSSPFVLERHLGKGTQVIFNTSELGHLVTTSNGQIKIMAFNYSHKTIEDKTYIFELSKKITLSVPINP